MSTPALALEAREGILHVRPSHLLDDELSEEIRSVLEQMPTGVPTILELGDGIGETAAEVGVVLSLARLVVASDRMFAICATDEVGQRLSDLGLDRMVHIASTVEACERHLTADTAAAAE